MTVGKLIKEERKKQYMSLAEVGQKCGVTRATIWKIEKGHLPKGETFAKILTDGLGFKEGGKNFNDAIAMWTNERIKSGQISPGNLAGRMAEQDAGVSSEMKKFLRKVEKLTTDEFEALDVALGRPSVVAGIFALNAAYDRKK